MAIAVTLYNPAGSAADITAYVNAEGIGTLNLRLEDDNCSFVADDVDIDLINDSGYFVGGSGIWTLPLDPTLKTSESTGNGQWRIAIAKNGATRWVGDLDPASVMVDYKTKIISTTWLGKVKRAEIDATSVKRAVPSPLYFTCVRHNRKLTLYSDSGHTTPLTVADSKLVVGDRIRVDQLTRDGVVVEQELEVKELSGAGLNSNQVRVRQGCKKAYTQGEVIDPFHKSVTGDDLLVSECAALLFTALGVAGGKQVISSTEGGALKVDTFNTKDKSIAECLTELAEYSGCIWFCDTTKWYFIDRTLASDKTASKKDISALLCNETKQASQEEWYDCVRAVGTPPLFSPNSEPRSYLYGSGRSKVFEIETEFTSSLTVLQSIAEQVYDSVCLVRKKAEITVLDDGTAYQIFDRVTFDSEDWDVVEVSEDVRSVDAVGRGLINLTVISEAGTAIAATGLDHDRNLDDDPPYPPTLTALSSGKLSKRQSWWSDFRAVWPASEVPLIIKDVVTRETVSGDETLYEQKYMLWAIQFTYDYFGDTDDSGGIDGFEFTVFKDGEDPENVTNDGHFARRHKVLRNPKPDGTATPAKAGHFFGYFYKPLLTNAPNFNVVARTFIHGKELSAFSEELSTADYGGPDDGSGDLTAPVIQQVLRQPDGAGGYHLQIIFGYGETLDATKPVHVWIDTSADIVGDPETGTGWSATAENIITAMATGSNWYVNCPHYDGSTDITTVLPASAKIALAVFDDAGTPVRQSEFAYADWADLAGSIPATYPTSFEFDDPNNKIDATWAFSTFTGYAYAVTLHGTTIDNCTLAPVVPTNNVLTPAQWENATNYQKNANGQTFTIVDSGEGGHKYFTITAATSQEVDHPVGTETETTLFATCCMMPFLLDGSGNMVFGKWGRRFYVGSDHIQFPDLALDWHYNAAMGTNFIRASWIDNGTTYYMPIQNQVPGAMGWTNQLIANTFQTNGTTKYYDLANPSTGLKWRFRLATVNTYGNDLADATHGGWVNISFTGGGDF